MTDGRPPTRTPGGALSPADWAQLESVVDALLDTPPERRAVLLAQVSGGDPVRRAELERLVAECERPHPLLDQPAAKRFASLVDEQAERISAVLADRYEIAREIGRGGMATVYLARDVRHSREVAVKVLRPELAATLGGARFLREIEIAARLRHPNIVPLYDSGWVPGLDASGAERARDAVLYYVMPYEAGQSVRERLARGPLPIDDVQFIVRDVCDALAYAHRAGIVHRDIKPDNVLLSGRHAMVTDFGVAKALTVAADAGSSSVDAAHATTAGVSLGTPAYMAPEQIAADPKVDHRADIYALGVLAYELLAGRPPFHDEESQSVLAAHLSKTPESIQTLRPDVPEALGDVVMKCLAKRPADRWQSVDEIVARLESGTGTGADSGARHAALATAARNGPVSVAPRRRRRLLGFAAAVVATSALLALLIDGARRRNAAATPLDPRKIAVVPFRVTGADSLQYLAEGVVDLLAATLTGEGGPVAVDSRTAISAWNRVTAGTDATVDHVRRTARMLGAAEAMSGSIVGLPGNRLAITVNVVSTSGGAALAPVTVNGSADSVVSLLDAVVTGLVARRAGVTEQTLGALTSESMPALRAYLWGRAEYRRGHDREAVELFGRALQLDSTFALAALDLVAATGQPLGLISRCRGSDCTTSYFALGFRNPGTEADHRRLTEAANTAWRYRHKLSARDLPLLEALRAERADQPTSAHTMISMLRRAATSAPDRVETHYLLGMLLLYQGPAVEVGDAWPQAAAAFRRAIALDPAYVPPIAGLIEVAAYSHDTDAMLKARDMYLARDSVGSAADYVRWRVAATLGDTLALTPIRARFDSLDEATLQRIIHASMMSGLDLADAERASSIVLERASDPLQRRIALASGFALALNMGRPREAAVYLRRRAESGDGALSNWTWAAMARMFWDGDSLTAEQRVRDRNTLIAGDTIGQPTPGNMPGSIELARHLSQQGLWDYFHGDTARAAASVRWLRRNGDPLGADFVDVLIATRAQRVDASTLRARIDSITLEGCCGGGLVNWANLVVAQAHEQAGHDADALRAVRRGVWRFPPQLLSTFLREEGRLAARTGDRTGAIRAYRHYLALRSNPDPELRPEVARIRAALTRLEQNR
jgi:tetratricopeptide (TPR) repeat protein